MSKKQYHLQKYIQDAANLEKNYQDKNWEKLCRLLIDELLFSIQDIPFRMIIDNYLRLNIFFHGDMKINSISWHYTADSNLIEGCRTYSFRFPNVCDPSLYQTFNIHAKNLFQKSKEWRHHSDVWYNYLGKNLLQFIGQYLDIQRIVHMEYSPITKLFVNQREERVDIYFYFKSINTNITITFEPGPPSRTA